MPTLLLEDVENRLSVLVRKNHLRILRRELVGLGRLELPTSPLSGVRSSHLSYRPVDQRLLIAPRHAGDKADQTAATLFKLVELVGIEPATS